MIGQAFNPKKRGAKIIVGVEGGARYREEIIGVIEVQLTTRTLSRAVPFPYRSVQLSVDIFLVGLLKQIMFISSVPKTKVFHVFKHRIYSIKKKKKKKYHVYIIFFFCAVHER
jgi:hypothetical protein